MVVRSLQGRDKGRLYAVVSLPAEGKAAVADGVKRPLSSPKVKNIKHLQLSARNLSEAGLTAPWDKSFDCRAARFLKVLESGGADKEKSEE